MVKGWDYISLLRLDRPVGTFLLLWPTLWAVVLANKGLPTWQRALIFIVGVTVMRSAGCIVNDLVDSRIDLHVQRTKNRPIPAGRISKQQALRVLVLLLMIAMILVWQLNYASMAIAFAGVGLMIFYPFTKRFFPFPQLILGIVWSLGLLMAFTAADNSNYVLAMTLYITHLLLTIGYDSMYAMVDKPDDLQLGLHSAAIFFGQNEPFYIALFQIAAWMGLFITGLLAELTWPYWLCLVVVAGQMIYQHYLIRSYEASHCLRAFKNNQWLGLTVLIGIVASLV